MARWLTDDRVPTSHTNTCSNLNLPFPIPTPNSQVEMTASKPEALPAIKPEHGHVDAHSPSALKETGNQAVKEGDHARAARMYIPFVCPPYAPTPHPTLPSSPSLPRRPHVCRRRAPPRYTLGIDMIIGQGRKVDQLTAAEWYELDQGENGVLHELLSNRSQ